MHNQDRCICLKNDKYVYRVSPQARGCPGFWFCLGNLREFSSLCIYPLISTSSSHTSKAAWFSPHWQLRAPPVIAGSVHDKLHGGSPQLSLATKPRGSCHSQATMHGKDDPGLLIPLLLDACLEVGVLPQHLGDVGHQIHTTITSCRSLTPSCCQRHCSPT